MLLAAPAAAVPSAFAPHGSDLPAFGPTPSIPRYTGSSPREIIKITHAITRAAAIAEV